MSEKPVRKKVAKKTTRKVVKKTAVKKVVRKKVARSATRKAPTPIAETNMYRKKSNRTLMIAGGVFLVIILASAGIGFTGEGSIEVNNTVRQRIEEASPEDRAAMENAGSQTNRVPPAALVPVDPDRAKALEEARNKVNELNSTTTDQLASTTDESLDDFESTAEDLTEPEAEQAVVEPEPEPEPEEGEMVL